MVWSDEGRHLSERLRVMARKVDKGQSFADIGADHGYLGLYLYEQGISPKVVITDISEASLAKAKAASGASQFGNRISFRVGDGLEVLEPGEVDCVAIAGMGGKLIRDILSADIDKTLSYSKFILQPRTGAGPLRKWLLEAGFSFISEDIVEEGDFLPEIITVAPEGKYELIKDVDFFEFLPGRVDMAGGIRNTLLESEESDTDGTGPADHILGEDSIHFSVPLWMLSAEGPILKFLDRKISIQEGILDGMSRAKDPDPEAMAEVEYNLDYLRQLRQLRAHKEQHEAEMNE